MNIVDLIKGAIRWIKNLVKRIINGIFSFAQHCVQWFKEQRLDKNKHVPFVANEDKFKEMLKTAPVKNVGIFQGVYDEEVDEIISSEVIEADALDAKTRQVLGNEDLVVLA